MVLLTGASSGLGRATAIALASRGAIMHLVARRRPQLDHLCGEIRASGGRATAHVVDLCDAYAIDRLASEVSAEAGGVDVLINNAGVGPLKSFVDTTDDDWRWTLDTNLHAIVRLTRAFLPSMLDRGRGTIVNVASLAGLFANPLAAYTASKFAVVGLSESLLIEYGGRGIEVVVVCPGAIATEMVDASTRAGRSSPDVDVRLRQFLGRYGAPPEAVADDIARAIERPRFLVLSPRHATVLRTLHRLFPGQMRRAFRRFGE